MPWIKEINYIKSLSDYGPAGTEYADCYAKATLTVKTSGNKLTVLVDMETKKYPFISMHLIVNGETLIKKAYYKNTSEFPVKNGSQFGYEATDFNGEEVKIKFKLLTSQNFNSSESRYNNSPTIETTLTRAPYTTATKGSTTITDNFNNTFSITATKGTAGTNNPTALKDFKWGYTKDYGSTVSLIGELSSKTIIISLDIEGTTANRTVYASSTTDPTYGESLTATATKSIKQYIAPTKPGAPEIEYTKSRLTNREDWKISWEASGEVNGSSPLKGYRIRILRKRGNGTWEALPITDINGSILSTTTSRPGDWVYDREGESNSITINPIDYGFLPGDGVQIQINSYTRYGEKNTGSLLHNQNQGIAEYTVQNAGVIRVKQGNSWVEGQVHVYKNGKWQEAETVNVWKNNDWRESQ